MSKQPINNLLDRYLAGQCTAEEEALVHKWLDETAEEDNDWSRLNAEQKNHWIAANYLDIQKSIGRGKLRYMTATRWVAAVAAVLILVAGIWYLRTQNTQPNTPTTVQTKDVGPGSNKAILTLANGEKIILDSVKGQLANQGDVTVINLDGILRYQGNEEIISYNTITTPRGGQYQIVLADGSRVWLNAASSLRFPTSFPGSERAVELTGEGYFEVAHNTAKPFRVSVGSMQVQVLGTHFNINSYTDEPSTKTTLLQGKVRVTGNNQTRILEPGKQAVLHGDQLQIIDADTEAAIAWRKGFFEFNNLELSAIMRQINRWYDVEVVYQGSVTKELFGGRIGRNLKLSEILKLLETQGAKFKFQGKRIIVLE